MSTAKENILNTLERDGKLQLKKLGKGRFHSVYVPTAKEFKHLSTKKPLFVIKIANDYPCNNSKDIEGKALVSLSRQHRKCQLIHPELHPQLYEGYQLCVYYTKVPKGYEVRPHEVCLYYENERIMVAYQDQSVIVRNKIEETTLACHAEILQILTAKRKRSLTIDQRYAILKVLGLPYSCLMMDFVDGELTTDKALSEKVLRLYQEHRVIALDAYYGENFLSTPTNEIFCIDFDYLIHRESPISQDYVDYEGYEFFKDHFDLMHPDYPKTIETIQSLLYLEKYLSKEEILDKYLTAEILELVNIRSHNQQPISVEWIQMMLESTLSNKRRMNIPPHSPWKRRTGIDAFFQPISDNPQKAISAAIPLPEEPDAELNTLFDWVLEQNPHAFLSKKEDPGQQPLLITSESAKTDSEDAPSQPSLIS